MEKSQNAISPRRTEDFPQWYLEVIKAAELAENSVVRGCMVIKPWGYGVWERLQRQLDDRIKATGHENAYFPLFIPLSFLEKEAAHVEGFAKECAVVTHHRLEAKDGKLVPAGELEEPVIVRPTSETIIGESFSRWIKSYRDLPLLINQWANVVRWEMRTRMFLRTSEFLWQEGHTAHATEKEAMDETLLMLKVYQEVMEQVCALPVITGYKPAHERFPGAEQTYTLEAMMQDRKAVQAGTSHYLGTNFAKAAQIKFQSEQGTDEYAHTTSWGVSTRLVGSVIMAHSDDDGLRLPPRLAPKHVVILPVTPDATAAAAVLAACESLKAALEAQTFAGTPVAVTIDKRDIRGGEKAWQWVKKGIPLRIEIGPRDLEKNQCCLLRRDRGVKEKQFLPLAEVPAMVPGLLQEIQESLFAQAQQFLRDHLHDSITTFEEFGAFFAPKDPQKPEIHGGFVLAPWCEDPASVEKLEPLKVTVRCIPLEQPKKAPGVCILTGKPATVWALFAKNY